MALLNFLNLIALATLITFSNISPVTALSVESGHIARRFPHSHNAIAKRKRALNSRRCKPRPSSKPPKPEPVKSEPAKPNPKPSSPKPSPEANNASSNPKPNPKPNNSNNNNNNNNNNSDNSGSDNSGNHSGGGGGGGVVANPKGKIGLAWPNGDDPNLSKFVTDKVGPIYTWSPWKPKDADRLGLQFMPMLWGDKQIGDFQKLVKPGYAKFAMGFNEPNQRGQADMTPEHGVDLWLQYLNPLKSQGYTLISPATTSAPSGKKWMQDFFRICNGRCKVDAVALHYYDVSADGFIKYVEDFHNTFKMPIYVTEFACQNFNGGPQRSKQEVNDFMTKVTSWMDSTPWVAAYFAFGVMHDMQGVNQFNQLMAANGGPTDLGFKYIN